MAVLCVQLLTVVWTGYGETTYLPILHGLSYLPSLWQFALQICRHSHCGRIRPDLKHGFLNLPPLSVFRDIFLRHVDCHRAVRHGGDHLTEGLRPHVAHGVNAGNTGFRGLSGHDIAAAVQRQLTHRQRRGGLSAHADKYAVAVHHAFLTGDGVPQADAGQPVPGKQRGNGAVPAEFHIFGLFQWLVIDLGGPQGVSAVDEDHFFSPRG